MITLIPNNSTSHALKFKEGQSTFKSEVLDIVRYTSGTHIRVATWVWVIAHSKLSEGYHNILSTRSEIESKVIHTGISIS